MSHSEKIPKEVVEITIEKIVPGGEGMARVDGRVLFVAGVLPGEQVRVAIMEAKKDFARGHLLEVLVPSADRIVPPCSLAGRCGGCDWQHIRDSGQAQLKIAMVRDALLRTGGLDYPTLEIETGSPWGYRNRLQIHGNASGQLGFLERRGHDLVHVQQCMVSHPAFGSLFAQGDASKSGTRFHAFGCEEQDGSYRLWQENANTEVKGKVTLLGKEFSFPVAGFFQSNLEMLARLIPYALDGLNGSIAWDFYAGVGVFGVFLAEHFKKVICVESNAKALVFAKQNLSGKESEYLTGRLEELLVDPHCSLRRKKPDAIVLDPPREGLAQPVRSFLKECQVAHLVYVSCNPVTLARDLKDLLAGPYVLDSLRLFDFYPQTSHVEAVAKFRLRSD